MFVEILYIGVQICAKIADDSFFIGEGNIAACDFPTAFSKKTFVAVEPEVLIYSDYVLKGEVLSNSPIDDWLLYLIKLFGFCVGT